MDQNERAVLLAALCIESLPDLEKNLDAHHPLLEAVRSYERRQILEIDDEVTPPQTTPSPAFEDRPTSPQRPVRKRIAARAVSHPWRRFGSLRRKKEP